MIRRPPRSTLSSSSAASDVYKRQCVMTVRSFLLGPTYPSAGEDLRTTTVSPDATLLHRVDSANTMPGAKFLKQRRAGVFQLIHRHTVGEAHGSSQSELGTMRCLEKCFGASYLDLEHYLHVLVQELFSYPFLLQAGIHGQDFERSDQVAEIVADLMGAHRNNMEKLYYQKTTILMAECKHIYQKPLFLVADLGKPTSFGAQQRATRRLCVMLYPQDFSRQFNNCIDDARGDHLRHPTAGFLPGYTLHHDYCELGLSAGDDATVSLDQRSRMFVPKKVQAEGEEAVDQFVKDYFHMDWDGRSHKPQDSPAEVWCAIVMMSVIGQDGVQEILNGAGLKGNVKDRTAEDIHQELNEWFNELSGAELEPGLSADNEGQDDEQQQEHQADQEEESLDEFLQLFDGCEAL
eukprot:TRINITY_DN11880_c0_g1_i3.p1 TRINITY_DN11880_c0_g1~~TRINITY_DN11880_c0_g1_i3.p1  ORF type:complete len:405 (+),score=98.80 TRINITY_DN11880_c0_g1_i3:98-1312(+)